MLRSHRTTPSRRGAARVSAVWIIVVIVLFLVSIAFAFIAQSDLSQAREELDTARAERVEAQRLQGEQADLKRAVTRALGFYDETSADPVSDIRLANAALEDLKQTFPDLGTPDDTFEEILPKIKSAYLQKERRIAEIETRIATLENEIREARDAAAQAVQEKSDRIAALEQQIADDAQNATARQEELERQLASARQQVSDRDNELRAERTRAAGQRRELEQLVLAKDTRIRELAEATKFAKEPFNQYPDGQIVSVSDKLNLGWIDLGANQRLTRGTRFRVEDARPGSDRVKAWAEVTRVEANRSEVVFTNLTDPFDRVVPGDVIINELYDPTGGRNAVLVGRFSGAYNERELTLLLERMGINVQPALDRTTHFLIVGQELWNDPDTNEPLEEPIQPSELAVFKDAEANGVQIVPLQDIRQFFRIESGSAGR